MNAKIKLLFASSRPLSWVNTAYPFAAGYLFFTQRVDLIFIIGTLFFLIPYNLLMYGVNDVYDYESDLRNPRKGGVEGAVVSKKYHRLILTWAYGLPIPFVIALGFLAPKSLGVLLGCLFFVLAYSVKGLRFKEIPVLDSITSSLHFVGPLLYALSLVGWPAVAWPAVIAFFAWGVASQSFGAIQDIVADRAAKIRSIATVFGAHTTWLFSAYAYLIAVIAVMSYGNLAALIVAIAGSLYIINILPFWHVADTTAATTRTGWKRFLWLNYVAGFIVTITLIAISIQL
jgi:4-hydroxybenzoate polyprenyltransferase